MSNLHRNACDHSVYGRRFLTFVRNDIAFVIFVHFVVRKLNARRPFGAVYGSV
jgi:hypothetical protein